MDKNTDNKIFLIEQDIRDLEEQILESENMKRDAIRMRLIEIAEKLAALQIN